MAARLGILFFGIIQGILIGVVLSLLLLIARSSTHVGSPARPRPATPTPITRSRPARRPRDRPRASLIVRVDGPLFFADADRFRTRIQELVRADGVASRTS